MTDSTSPGPPAVKTLDLSKTFGSKTALAGLTLSVGKGEVFGFLGPNGAGKTTAVKLLVGLTTPTSGEAWVLDAPAGDIATRRRIGYLPELFRYQDWLTGREVLDLHCRLAGIPRRHRQAEIRNSLDISGLTGRGDDRAGSYSKGMQQRLGLGVAMLGGPDVLFLDEPTSALDPVGRHEVRAIIRQLKDRGATVFLNTHLLSEVEQSCDRVAIVDFGRVIASGTLDEVRNKVHGVKIQAARLKPEILTALASYGAVSHQGNTLMLEGAGDHMVPEIARLLVSMGADIFLIQPAGSLEDSFLELLRGGDHAGVDNGRSHTA